MNNKTVIFSASFLAGMLFFCTYQEWLIISWNRPHNKKEAVPPMNKKTVIVWREKNNTLIQESVQLLWSENQTENMKTLTTAWLSWLHDEQVLTRKLLVESILFSPSGYEMYISFDHNPFEKQWSIHQKEIFINGLLKSYKENGCTASYLYILVHHKPLQDINLDFNEPWHLTI